MVMTGYKEILSQLTVVGGYTSEEFQGFIYILLTKERYEEMKKCLVYFPVVLIDKTTNKIAGYYK
jgi:hypothetical protein